MNNGISTLAKPLALPCGAVLPNRFAKSAMSENLADAWDAAPNERHVRLYARWGAGGAGLLLTGNVMIAMDGRSEFGNVVVEDERHLPLLRRWAEAAQAHGAQLWMQLNHAGRQAPRTMNRRPVAPSAIAVHGMGDLFAVPRPLAHDEILALVQRFATSAAVAQRAGFAGVQLHAAHGYLISQFLSPLSNTRDDAWGGDAERRMRFLLEIVRAIRAAVGARFPIGVKLNSADFQRGGMTNEDAALVVGALAREGVDLIEVSGGSYEAPAMIGRGELDKNMRASSAAREAYFLEAAQLFRASTTVPLMLTGGMRTAAGMCDAVAGGAVDVVGLARPLAYEPDLPARLLSGAANAAQSVKLATGVRVVDDVLQVFWFQLQLHRMADGNEPKPRLSRVAALMHAWRVNRRPKARTALRAPAREVRAA
jgi:2,4-dienoyl-CoA reductase-like NADH-dependent reductase (Old Yellow Enzyme family)